MMQRSLLTCPSRLNNFGDSRGTPFQEIITTSFAITGMSTSEQTLSSNEIGFIGVNGALVVNTGGAISGSGINSLTILGALVNQSYFLNHTAYDFSGSSATVLVGATGIIASHSHAIYARPTAQFLLTNDGVITAEEIALNIVAGNSSANIQVINNGTVSGQADGMYLLSGGQSTTIINTGTINGVQDGIRTDDFFQATTGTSTLVNSGTIIGVTGSAYFGRGGVDDITNSGVMFGGIILGAGDDIYDGTLGSVSGAVLGGAGKDRLTGGADADNLQGGGDNDTIRGSGGDDKLLGQAGNDKIRGGAGDDFLSGAAGNDQVWGHLGEDDINGGNGDDTLRGGADDDEIHGDKGEDNICGGHGDDTINGGDGRDTIRGNGGNDTIKGGSGNDTFIFANRSGHDIIEDFNATANGEKIDLSAVTAIRSFNQLSSAASQIGTDVLIDTGSNNSILLLGVNLADLGNGDFIF